jgi:hypothetical protein
MEAYIFNEERMKRIMRALPWVKFDCVLERVLDIQDVYFLVLDSAEFKQNTNTVNHGNWGKCLIVVYALITRATLEHDRTCSSHRDYVSIDLTEYVECIGSITAAGGITLLSTG